MIDWIYSDPVAVGFASGVTRGGQKILEGGKTIVGTSNRFRVVTDVGYGDFTQLGRALGVARVLSRLCDTSWRLRDQPRVPPRSSGPSSPDRLLVTKTENPI